MPLYDFNCTNPKCDNCKVDTEILCKHSEIPSQTCGLCQQPLTRVIRPPETPQVPHISWSQWRAL